MQPFFHRFPRGSVTVRTRKENLGPSYNPFYTLPEPLLTEPCNLNPQSPGSKPLKPAPETPELPKPSKTLLTGTLKPPEPSKKTNKRTPQPRTSIPKNPPKNPTLKQNTKPSTQSPKAPQPELRRFTKAARIFPDRWWLPPSRLQAVRVWASYTGRRV